MLIIMRSASVDGVLHAMNNFDQHIRITHDSSDLAMVRHSSFLDLNIYLRTDQSIDYTTYRKPKRTYSYVPYISCHSRATKLGIVPTEVIRMLRTNSAESDFIREIILLSENLGTDDSIL